MTSSEKLMALGAQCVGGDLIYRHKVLGSFRNDDFNITPDGVEMLKVTDVEVKAPKPAAKTAPAAKTVPKPEVDEDEDEDEDEDVGNTLDEMLGE